MVVFLVVIYVYLSFNASTGFIFMALVAGISPANVPSIMNVAIMMNACAGCI